MDVHASGEVELEEVVGDFGATLSREDVHVVLADRQCKVAAGGWDAALLVHLWWWLVVVGG